MKGGHALEPTVIVVNGREVEAAYCTLCNRTFCNGEAAAGRCNAHIINKGANLGRVIITGYLPFHPKHGLRNGREMRVVDERAGELWVMGDAGIPIKLDPDEYKRCT